MKKLIVLCLLSAASCCLAQNVRFDAPFPSISSTTSTPYLVANVPPNSPTLAVCSSPANQVPCTNYVTVFDSTGAACPNGAQDTPQPQPSACQSTGDAEGNIGFWAPTGQYDYTVCVRDQCYGPFTVTLGGSLPAFGSGSKVVTTDLTTTTNGDCAGWLTGNVLGDIGICLTGSPAVTQTITQPATTSFSPNILQRARYATNYQWSQSPTSPSTIAVGPNVVTINGVLGVSAYSVSKVKHYLWLSTVGTPERVLITGTSCTGVNTGTCTVTFTAANTHSAGYTLGTATAGWQEAWVDASPVTISAPIVAAKVLGSPDPNNANIYVFNAPLDIDISRSGTQGPVIFDFQGSAVSCNTPGLHCFDISTGTAGTLGLQPQGLVIRDLLVMAASTIGRTANGTTIAIYDNGQKTRLENVFFGGVGSTTNVFDDLVVVNNDQNFSATHTQMNTGSGPPLTCDATYCGSGFKGLPSSIGYISDSDLSMQCKGNGIDWPSGNSLGVVDTNVQAYNQFGIRASSGFDTAAAMTLFNVYQEVGSCTNPLGTGVAGIITQSGLTRIIGGNTGGGKIQAFTASNTGGSRYNYWVGVNSSTLGVSTLFYAGYCLSNATGTCTVKWPQVGTAGTITYDLIRIVSAAGLTDPSPYTAICTGGTVNACGSVATGLTTAICSGGACTQSDDVTASTSSYTVAVATYYPVLQLWGAGLVISPSADTNSVNNGTNAKVSMDRFPMNTLTGNIVSVAGRRVVPITMDWCDHPSTWSTLYIHCENFATSVAQNQASVTPMGGAGVSTALKGIQIFELDPQINSSFSDIITIGDSNPAKTAATPGNRPSSDAADTAIGIDQASNTTANWRLGLRAPIGHRWYVNSVFDNASWLEDMTSAIHSYKVTHKDFALAAPTGGAGFGNFWFDSTDNRYDFKNNSNTKLFVAGIVASGTSTLGNTLIGAGACATTVTTTATGTATTDTISWAFASAPATADATLNYTWYVTANNVNWKVCNTSALGITPTGLVVNWHVDR